MLKHTDIVFRSDIYRYSIIYSKEQQGKYAF